MNHIFPQISHWQLKDCYKIKRFSFPFRRRDGKNTLKYSFFSPLLEPENRRMSCWTNKKLLLLLLHICVSLFMRKTLKGALHDYGKFCFSFGILSLNNAMLKYIFIINWNWQRVLTPSDEPLIHSLVMCTLPPSLPPFLLHEWGIELDENLNFSLRQWGRKLHSAENFLATFSNCKSPPAINIVVMMVAVCIRLNFSSSINKNKHIVLLIRFFIEENFYCFECSREKFCSQRETCSSFRPLHSTRFPKFDSLKVGSLSFRNSGMRKIFLSIFFSLISVGR